MTESPPPAAGGSITERASSMSRGRPGARIGAPSRRRVGARASPHRAVIRRMRRLENRRWRWQRHLMTLSLWLGVISPAAAQSQTPVVTGDSNGRGFPLAAGGTAAPLFVSGRDFPGVVRAASDLVVDVERVTGHRPRIGGDSIGTARDIVLIGTLGKAPLIDQLVRERKLDARGIDGHWETWATQVVDRPFPRVDRALVIAGSDKRGTIYGVYDLSARIGVSPWAWWADVPAARQSTLYVSPERRTDGEPAVRYRGIFLNDEAPALSGFAKEKFGGFNQAVYEKVFELVLRLPGNNP